MSDELDTCHRIFAELEAQRGETLAALGAWPSDRLRFRPAPQAWCAIEVADHIVRAEAGTIGDMRHGPRNPNILGVEERPNVAALDRALRSEQSFVVPAAATSIHPDTETSLADVVRRWEAARSELRRMVNELSHDEACCGVFCHPFAGWMTFAEVMEHFEAHLYHHGFQLARLWASSGLGPAPNLAPTKSAS